MNKFTVEETNLLSIYQAENKQETMKNISAALSFMAKDMQGLAKRLITDSLMRNRNSTYGNGARWPSAGCRVPLLLLSYQAVEILVEHQIFLLSRLLDVYTGVAGIYSPHLVYLGADNHVHFF